MASIDGAPILFVLVSLFLLLVASPIAFWKRFSFGKWCLFMGAGIAGSLLGSVTFMVAGGSDHAPRSLILLPFLAAGLGARFSLTLSALNSSQPNDEEPGSSS